jgi:ParB-like chromosome segregation protein Spo0J
MSATNPILWRTERRRLGDLVDWDRNPRRITEAQAKQLAESIRRFGYVEEIVVNADGVSIIGGHMRRRVALAQALIMPDSLVDVRVPSRPLTDEERDELAIRLNRNTGEWDWDALANIFDTDDLLAWGFEEAELGIGGSGNGTGDGSEKSASDPVTCPKCGAVIDA